MSGIAEVVIELPDTESAVHKVFESERRKLKAWAAGLVKDIEAQRDGGLRRLDQAASVLAQDGDAVAKPVPPNSRRSRGRRGPTVAVLAERRRQAIYRFLVEQGRALAFSEIRRALRLSEFSTRSALKRLVEEGMVIRTGTRGTTRYEARPTGAGSAAVLPGPRPGGEGTLQGRLLETIEDRGSASAEELAQAIRAPREEVQKACGEMVREEEIRMASRDGRPVYVSQVAA